MAIVELAEEGSRRASERLALDDEKRERGRRSLEEREGESGLSTPWRLAPVLAQAADGLATYRNLKSGGEEYNPRLRGLAQKSPEALLALKVAQGVGTQALANAIHKKSKHSKLGRAAAKALSAISTAQGTYGASYSLANHKKPRK